MKNFSPDFPPLNQRQLDLPEELKEKIENLATLSALDPKVSQIRNGID
ncbi:MAG: hypothetical protein WCD80_08550 [Desulfobaccales bacterium]